MQKIINLLNVLFLGSCSVVPDLSESGIFAMAANDAVNLKSLERKFMYGMFDLWVDKEEDPFTGWAKSTHMQDHLKELGYLKNGRKEGLWMSWDENGTKISEVYWTEDRVHGSFLGWHSNGKIKVIGHTKDGEVNGKWTEYYASGQIACRSLSQMGHLEKIFVWQPDGSACEQSMVIDGNGTFIRYLEDGRVEHVRTFAKGVETSREIFNQR